jgi:hypothetical protein
MNIKIMCDWCGKTMKTVTSFEAVRDTQQKGDTICKTCRQRVGKIDRYFESVRDRLTGKMDLIVKELKRDFQKSLQKGDFDGREDIQDVGNKGKATSGRSK